MKDKAALASLGIDPCSSESSDDADDHVPGSTPLRPEVNNLCKHSLVESKYNWFALMELLENHSQVDDAYSISQNVFLALPSLGFSPEQIGLVKQSF